MTTSILRSTGSLLGKGAAYCVHGTALAGTQLAQGAAEGYALKAEQLRAQRMALAAPPAAPARQKKLVTAS